ncbi:MAG: 50S ribosomal protein L24 [Thermoguttaceae bacterium]|jgi:large subunit ribosomal protein L24
MLIRQDDMVTIVAGDDRGTRGKVLRVNRAAGKVVVEGVNRVYKHVRRSQRNPQGGRLSMEMAIPVSNVALLCAACGAGRRVGVRTLPGGGKERYCKKCGKASRQIAPPKNRRAKK